MHQGWLLYHQPVVQALARAAQTYHMVPEEPAQGIAVVVRIAADRMAPRHSVGTMDTQA